MLTPCYKQKSNKQKKTMKSVNNVQPNIESLRFWMTIKNFFKRHKYTLEIYEKNV